MMKRRAADNASEVQDLTMEDEQDDEEQTTAGGSSQLYGEPVPVWGGAVLSPPARDEPRRRLLNDRRAEASTENAVEQTTCEKVDNWLETQRSICSPGQPMPPEGNNGMEQTEQLVRTGQVQAGSSRPLGQQNTGVPAFQQQQMPERSAFSQLNCIRLPMFGLGSNVTGSTISSLIAGPPRITSSGSATPIYHQLPMDLPMIGVPLIQHIRGGPVEMLTTEMLRDMVDHEEKQRELRACLYALLHARNCQTRRFDLTEQPCPVQRCEPFRIVLEHISVCSSGKFCKYPTCEATNRLLAHWRVCTENDCGLCGPVRRGDMEQLQSLFTPAETPAQRSSEQLRERSRQAQAEAAMDIDRTRQYASSTVVHPPVQQPRENRQSRRTPKGASKKNGRKKQ